MTGEERGGECDWGREGVGVRGGGCDWGREWVGAEVKRGGGCERGWM